MTQIINIWKDEILEDEISSYIQLEEYEKIIIHYLRNRYYNWYWIAIWKRLDWKYSRWDLSHCSCNWPFEKWCSWIFTKKEIIKLINEWYNRYQKLGDKYINIFNGENKNKNKFISLLDN